MAQSFISTYKNHYRWPDYQRTLACKQDDVYEEYVVPESDIWYQNVDDTANVDLVEAGKWIHKLYLKRMWSTYQRDYCKDLIEKSIGEPMQQTFENELLVSSKNLYEPDNVPKILPTIPGTRKIFGYIRPRHLLTPLTNYQYFFGKTAYELLRHPKPRSTGANDVPEEGSGEKHHSSCICCKCQE